ncbi:MAG: hypothetical protein LBQ30_08085 [Treponema sp.]|jgi:hypothetical protein|nr:hypothetical protein [Treponema sp.]
MNRAVLRNLLSLSGAILLGGILLYSCKQYAIFYSISLEVEPVDPKIKGMPTNMVVVGTSLYGASKFSDTIHCYSESRWTELTPKPGGQILELAATNTKVYALTGEPGSSILYSMDTGQSPREWKPVASSSHPNIQSIYGAGDSLFAGAMTGSDTFAVLYDKDGTLQALEGDMGLLRGAAFDGTAYYLAGTGIYTLTDTTLSQVSGTAGVSVVGLITVDSTILGVSRDGKLFFNDSGGFTSVETGATFTGALGLWKKDAAAASHTLLLLGIQGGSTSTTHGYREIILKDGKLDTDKSLHIPGKDPSNSSVSDYDKYNSSLGKHPVVMLRQAQDGILFAGTTKNGLWSYRNEQWNAEP